MYKSLCMLVCVCVLVIVAYYCMWCLVYVCMKIHMQCDKHEAVYRIGERSFNKLCNCRAEKKFFIDLYTIPTVFYCIFRFFRFFHFLSLST